MHSHTWKFSGLRSGDHGGRFCGQPQPIY